MTRISRREFNRLAALGAAVSPLTGISAAPEPQEQAPEARPNRRIPVTAGQSKKVNEEIAKREEQLAGMRARTLPYGLEPAFVFSVRTARHAPPVNAAKD
jgi:predicted 2-oxoglutarate/Fe(II)-dependent dioxygenase YbiX